MIPPGELHVQHLPVGHNQRSFPAAASLLDQTGSYTTLYLTVAGLVSMGVVLHARVGRPRRPLAV